VKELLVSAFIHFLLSSLLYAQSEDSKKTNWGIAVGINSTEAQIGTPEYASWGYAGGNFKVFGDIVNKSFSVSIVPKYFIRNDILLRIEFGITKITMTNYYDNQASSAITTHSTQNQSIEQNIYRFVPGVQWSFMKKKFIESYFGITISYLRYNDMNYHNIYETKELPSNTTTFEFDDKGIATGGFAMGFGGFAGFNIYLEKHFSIGAEFSSALLYKKIGSGFSGEVVSQTIPNPPTTEVYSYSTSSYKGFQFSKMLSSINISFYF